MNLLLGVLEASVVGSIAILIFCLFSVCYGSRFKKKAKMLVWTLMALRLLLPVHFEVAEAVVTVEMPVVSLLQETEREMAEAEENTVTIAEVYKEILLDSVPLFNKESVVRKPLTSGHAAALVWLAGGVLFLAYHFGMYYAGKEKIYRESFVCEDVRILQSLKQQAAALKIRKAPEICFMENCDKSPFTMGFWCNTIFLPNKDYEDKELNYVLKHELVHCKNKDVLKKGIMLIVNAVHWFNPLVWFMRRLVNQDMEMLCDEEVLGARSKAECKEYSEVIMSCILEENTDKNVLSTSFVHGTEFMKRRFENIFDGRKKKVGVVCITGVCIIVILLSGVMQIEENLLQNSAVQSDYGEQGGTEVDRDAEVLDSESIEEKQNTELQAPTQEEVLEKRSTVLSGMSEEDIAYMSKIVKNANLRMERDYLYGNTLKQMENPDSLCWNYIDELGEIHIGWGYNTADLEKKELWNLSDEEFNEKYGTRVVAYNEVDGAIFIEHMSAIKDTILDEDLKQDFDALIWNMEQAMDTHDVDYLYQIYRIFHDMDYYLLRYGPQVMAGYVRDVSTVGKYYGVLEVYK